MVGDGFIYAIDTFHELDVKFNANAIPVLAASCTAIKRVAGIGPRHGRGFLSSGTTSGNHVQGDTR